MRQFIAVLILVTSALGQRPDVYVQWSRNHPCGFELVSRWAKQPFKTDPTLPIPQSPFDDNPGYVSALKVGQRLIYGCDHYAVEMKHSSVITYCWRDGQDVAYSRLWYGTRSAAEVCRDSAHNTKCVSYGPFGSVYSPTEPNKPFSEFRQPPDKLIRHGVTMPGLLWSEHKALWSEDPTVCSAGEPVYFRILGPFPANNPEFEVPAKQ